VCPVEAIFYEDDTPDQWKDFYKANVEFFDDLGSPGGAAKIGKQKTSTLQDVEAGRPVEVDALIGSVIEVGEMTGTPPRRVGEGAKGPVAQGHVARLQLRLRLRNAGQSVSSQRRSDDLLEQAATEMHQRQEVCGGKAAARKPPAVLAEMFPELRRIGHREAGAVDHEQTMSEPAPRFAHALGHGGRRTRQQTL